MLPAQNFISVSRRPLDVEDYIDLLRRHRSWIVGPTFAGLVIAVVAAFLWPETYQSTASLRIIPQSVSEKLVPSISVELNERINSLRTAILSRNFLLPLIQRLKLYPNITSISTTEDAYERMYKDIHIDPVLDTTGRSGATLFRITFAYTDRFQAKAVVEALVNEFTTQNVRVQQVAAAATQGFMSDEVKSAQARVDELQGQLAKFQADNQGKLPEEVAFNQNQVTTAQSMASQAAARISAIEQRKNTLETTLQNTRRNLDIASQSSEESAPSQVARNSNLLALQNTRRQQELLCEEKRARYQPNFPDVKACQKQLERLDKELATAQAQDDREQAATATSATAQEGRRPARQAAEVQNYKNQINQINSDLQNADADLAVATREKKEWERRYQEASARIQGSPWVAPQFAALNSELSLAKDRLAQQKRKEQDTVTSSNLEARGAGEQLEVLDQATLPTTPVEPNRYLIVFGGIAIGMLTGLVLAAAKEAKDSSLKNLKDVRAYTNLPVLTSVPLLENALLVRRKRRLYWLAWSSAVIVGVMAMAAAVLYYFHGQ